MNQSDLLGAVLSIFDLEKLDDASWLVSVDADGGTEGSLEFNVISVVPDLVAGSGPAHTPWQVILSQPTRAILNFPPCAFTHCPNHHPASEVHLPVPTTAQKTLFTQNLREDIVKVILAEVTRLLHVDHNSLAHYILSFTHPCVISNLHSCPFELNLWVNESFRLIHWNIRLMSTITYVELWNIVSATYKYHAEKYEISMCMIKMWDVYVLGHK